MPWGSWDNKELIGAIRVQDQSLLVGEVFTVLEERDLSDDRLAKLVDLLKCIEPGKLRQNHIMTLANLVINGKEEGVRSILGDQIRSILGSQIRLCGLPDRGEEVIRALLRGLTNSLSSSNLEAEYAIEHVLRTQARRIPSELLQLLAMVSDAYGEIHDSMGDPNSYVPSKGGQWCEGSRSRAAIRRLAESEIERRNAEKLSG